MPTPTETPSPDHSDGSHHAHPRDTRQAILRGFTNRCPKCGKGHMMRGYLQIVDRCENCGEPLGSYPAADGPAFFTITIIMLLLIPMIAATWVWFRLSPFTMLILLSALTTIMSLVLLRYVKGAFVGYLWAKDEQDPGA